MRERTWIEIVVAIAALIVSGVSLWVGVRTENANEQLVASSTWPFLQDNEEISNAPGAPRQITLSLVNSGVGPAKVETFQLFYRGQAMASPEAFLESCCGYRPGSGIHFSHGTTSPTVMRVGQPQIFLRLKDEPASDTVWRALLKALPEVTFVTCYCSTLGTCWKSDLKTVHPPRVTTCPAVAHRFAS